MANANVAIAYKEDKSFVDKCSHNFKFMTGTITFDGGDYVTGGVSMDLSKQVPTDLHLVLFENVDGLNFSYDYTNKTVKAYYYDYDAGADGAAIERATSAISSVVRFLAVGK